MYQINRERLRFTGFTDNPTPDTNAKICYNDGNSFSEIPLLVNDKRKRAFGPWEAFKSACIAVREVGLRIPENQTTLSFPRYGEHAWHGCRSGKSARLSIL
jgi:hypothetical protein